MSRLYIIYIISGIIFGYTFFLYTTGTKKQVGKKPKVGYLIQLYLHQGKCFHVHHWLQLNVILVILSIVYFLKRNIVLLPFIGFCIGGIIQGLTFPDRFSFITKCIEQ